MKYGTVLYQKGADILATLSWELSTSQLADYWSQPENQKHHEKPPNTEKKLKEASVNMNNLIHKEIKKSSQIRPTLDSLKINEYLKT